MASVEQVVGASTVILSPFSRAQALILPADATMRFVHDLTRIVSLLNRLSATAS